MADREQTAEQMPDAEMVRAVLAYIEGQLAWDLDDAALDDVRGNVERHLKMAGKLRAVPLRNADEPDFVFRPYRGEG